MQQTLNSFLSHAGVCSRREAVLLIKTGVVRVNGTIIKNPAERIGDDDIVTVRRKRIMPQRHVYYLLNKPKGYVTTLSDERGRQTVRDLFKGIKERIYPVGRLDKSTMGALLMTNDGELAQRLMHPKYKVKKVYDVQLIKPVLEKSLERLKKGIHLPDGTVKVDSAVHIRPRDHAWVRVTLHSGKYRIVRRLFEKMGYDIKSLDRVRYGHLNTRGVGRGSWRRLTKKEVQDLQKAGGLA